jgi:hypothetical protein
MLTGPRRTHLKIKIKKFLYYVFNLKTIFNSDLCPVFYNVPINVTKDRIKQLISILDPYINLEDCSFVEHACHDAHYISEIKRLLPTAHCTGTDISDTMLKINQQNSVDLNIDIQFKQLNLNTCFNLQPHAALSEYDVVIISDILYYLSEWNMPCFFYWTPSIQWLFIRRRVIHILKNWLQQSHIIIFSNHQYHKTVYPLLMNLVALTSNERVWLMDDFWLISCPKACFA